MTRSARLAHRESRSLVRRAIACKLAAVAAVVAASGESRAQDPKPAYRIVIDGLELQPLDLEVRGEQTTIYQALQSEVGLSCQDISPNCFQQLRFVIYAAQPSS